MKEIEVRESVLGLKEEEHIAKENELKGRKRRSL